MDIQFATFRIGQVYFAIDILAIKEFYKKIDYSLVNLAPSFVRGLLNLRGQIITLVDLKEMFFGEVIHFTKQTRCIILKSMIDVKSKDYKPEVEFENPTDRVGILVEEIGEMLTIPNHELEDAPANVSFIPRDYVKHVFKTKDQLFLILNFAEIFKDYLKTEIVKEA